MNSLYRFLIGFCSFHAAYGPFEAKAQDDLEVARILGAWEKRQQETKSIYFKVSGTRTFVKGGATGDPGLPEKMRSEFPLADHADPIQVELLLDLDNNRSRKHFRQMELFIDRGEFNPMDRTYLFDGKQCKTFEPREKNTSESYTPSPIQPDLVLHSILHTQTFFGPWNRPMLFAAGIVPKGNINARPEKQRTPFNASEYRIEGKGLIGTTECVILREKSKDNYFDEWWVDPGRDYAILRWRMAKTESTILSADIRYQQQGGQWLPQDWTYRKYGNFVDGKALSESEEMHVDEVTVNPKVKDKDFDVVLSPKMLVEDREHKKLYVVDSDGKTLLPAGTPLSRKFPYWLWWVIAAVLLLFTAYIVLRIRSRRRKAA